ncbi:MAG TPA: hypothetical protein VK974_07195 [Methylophilaceae bacterium]|nr:hypothetical protein [Methylophilaceae bacterium]
MNDPEIQTIAERYDISYLQAKRQQERFKQLLAVAGNATRLYKYLISVIREAK